MPRKPRVEMAGCHHIVNRGVERRDIFLEPSDYEKFLEILCDVCKKHRLVLHSYCLMTNHYHLLIETERENLSKAMRDVNALYAGYFNRKYKRIGHLWQGRFKSWFVTDDAYHLTVSSVPAKTLSEEHLATLLAQYASKQERNRKIMEALKTGYSQQQIATVLGLSQPAVSLIVKKGKE